MVEMWAVGCRSNGAMVEMRCGFLVVVGDAMVVALGLWVGWVVGFGGLWWAWDGLWVGV